MTVRARMLRLFETRKPEPPRAQDPTQPMFYLTPEGQAAVQAVLDRLGSDEDEESPQ